jgi:hypothetical protein
MVGCQGPIAAGFAGKRAEKNPVIRFHDSQFGDDSPQVPIRIKDNARRGRNVL